jgi:D-alanine-D-alanine ligase
MKITVLTYLEKEDSASYDIEAEQVAAALRQGGHKVSLFGLYGDPRKLVAGLTRRKQDLVFNLMESFGDDPLGYLPVAGLLDLLRIPYTGSGPGELYLQEDKLLTKKLLAFEHIAYPDFAVFTRDADLETGGSLRMPVFVKPLRMDASLGIGAKNLVHSVGDMMKRVAEIHDKVGDAALVEEYIEGREFYVGVLGNQDAEAFPPIEMDFSGLPVGAPHVMDKKAKWDKGSDEYRGTKVKVADVPDETRAKLQKAALAAYRALRVRDYGRVDLRLTEDGVVYVLEVNAGCYLEDSEEFATGARAAGLDYPTLVNRIVEAALARYGLPRTASQRRKKTAAHT